MKSRLLFPALRCRMGEWIYYVTYLRFQDVVEWIKPTEEVHSNKRLSEWIQRRLNSEHTDAIANYLTVQSERFFNSIVIGVYKGEPVWAPLEISVTREVDFPELSDDDEDELESSIGLLKFSGDEKFFAIDGQHRVAGIKKAVEIKRELEQEEVCAIFVGHQETQEGRERTRRLFTTLNKTAKKVSKADIVALDEDDGFAIVTRMMVNDFDLFARSERIAINTPIAIAPNDTKSINSIVGIYELAQDLYPKNPLGELPKKSDVLKKRPLDTEIDWIYRENCRFWNFLVEVVPEYQRVFVSEDIEPGEFRISTHNHLLFRPVGQRAFASSVQILMSRGRSMKVAISSLINTNLWLNDREWHYILWNPIQETIIAKNRVVAETFLLRQIGESGSSRKNDQRLNQILEARRDGLYEE